MGPPDPIPLRGEGWTGTSSTSPPVTLSPLERIRPAWPSTASGIVAQSSAMPAHATADGKLFGAEVQLLIITFGICALPVSIPQSSHQVLHGSGGDSWAS